MKEHKKPTMRDVAALSGVTQATVSNVVNRSAYVSSETESKVLSAIDQLGFIPNAMARGLKMKQTRTIGIVIPDVESGFYSALVNQLATLLRREDYMVFLCNTLYDTSIEHNLISSLIKFNVDGIIVCYNLMEKRCYKDINRYKIPLVTVDFRLDGEFEQIPSVETDNVLGCNLLMQHLKSLNVKRICLVSEPTWYSTLEYRLDSFVNVIKAYGLIINADDIYVAKQFYNKTNMGYDISNDILKRDLPDVICATTDNLAIGILRRMLENGVNIPKDVLLTGFDDISQCVFVTPNLTTVSQPIENIAKSCVQLMFDLINTRQPDEPNITLEPELIIRGSTKRIHF